MFKNQHISILNLRFCNWKRIIKVLIAIITLFIGGLIYVIYRSNELLMFNWFNCLGLNSVVMQLRDRFSHLILSEWVRYNLPAGLWLFSYMFIIDSIWNDNNGPIYRCFIIILPLVSLTSEIMQFYKIMPGTFDIIDIIGYVLAIILFIILKLTSK